MVKKSLFTNLLFSILLTIAILLSSNHTIFVKSDIVDYYSYETSKYNQKKFIIDKLYDMRLIAMLEGNTAKFNEITNELKIFGIEQISYSELCETLNVPIPKYVIEYENYLYERYSEDFKWDGKPYTYMVINITPTNANCNLSVRGSFSEHNYNTATAIGTIVLDVASSVIGEVNKIGTVLSLFDIAKNAYDNFSTSTLVSDVNAVYTWSFAEMSSFHYMPSAIGTSGFTMIGRSNKINGVISTSILDLKYPNGSGDATGTIDTYNYNISVTANNFDDGYATAVSKVSGEAMFVENLTEYLDIKGVKGETVHRVNFLNPLYPMIVN